MPPIHGDGHTICRFPFGISSTIGDEPSISPRIKACPVSQKNHGHIKKITPPDCGSWQANVYPENPYCLSLEKNIALSDLLPCRIPPAPVIFINADSGGGKPDSHKIRGEMMTLHDQSMRLAVQATHAIDILPAIPTQDWVTRCAKALNLTDPQAATISLVGSIDPQRDALNIYSSGVCLNPWHQGTEAAKRLSITLQDRCERLTQIGLFLPSNSCVHGLVSPISSLGSGWSDSPIARLVSPALLEQSILHILPIAHHEKTLCLLNVIGFHPDYNLNAPDRVLSLLRALHIPLRLRAQAALTNVNNPRAWLTDREQGVLELLILGHSVRVIAEQLGRSAHTIHDHVKNLHKKIGASSRGELIAKALGHAHTECPTPMPEPITLEFQGNNITELKPRQLTAQPLQN
jgi:DNA-binding CsgD family transcriptional regulator